MPHQQQTPAITSAPISNSSRAGAAGQLMAVAVLALYNCHLTPACLRACQPTLPTNSANLLWGWGTSDQDLVPLPLTSSTSPTRSNPLPLNVATCSSSDICRSHACREEHSSRQERACQLWCWECARDAAEAECAGGSRRRGGGSLLHRYTHGHSEARTHRRIACMRRSMCATEHV